MGELREIAQTFIIQKRQDSRLQYIYMYQETQIKYKLHSKESKTVVDDTRPATSYGKNF